MPKSKVLKDKIEKLKVALKTQEEKEKQEERDRKNDTKIKILIGAYVKSDPQLFANITRNQKFTEFLLRDADRKLFGFPPLEKITSHEDTGGKSEKTTLNPTYLNATYEEKEEVKKLGAKFDSSSKKWYVPDGVDLTPFAKWMPS